MNYTKWNDPNTYRRMTAELAANTVPETPIFAAREDECIEHSHVQYCMTSIDELHELLDIVDHAIVEAVAVLLAVAELAAHSLQGSPSLRS